jgi:hypothetical protein
VKVFPALLAEVLFGTGGLIHNADAPAMLPDLADVALDEQAAQIVADDVGIRQSRAWFTGIRWQARVFHVAAHASGDLVFLCHVLVGLIVELRGLVFVIVVFACPASGQRWLELRTLSRLFGLF